MRLHLGGHQGTGTGEARPACRHQLCHGHRDQEGGIRCGIQVLGAPQFPERTLWDSAAHPGHLEVAGRRVPNRRLSLRLVIKVPRTGTGHLQEKSCSCLYLSIYWIFVWPLTHTCPALRLIHHPHFPRALSLAEGPKGPSWYVRSQRREAACWSQTSHLRPGSG
jgi:hypothetical protein